jgi:4'-phosphopantetheinyl transferase EntD
MVTLSAVIVLDVLLEHGWCVGVRVPASESEVEALGREALVPDERAFAAGLAAIRRRTWIAGRVALRQALARSGVEVPAVLADERGAPKLPAGVGGSISHTETLAVALVGPGPGCVGIDVELDVGRELDIASKVLTQEEQAAIAGLDAAERGREVVLRFSAKEAVYKALDPFVRRYVGFKEVAVTPLPEGKAAVEIRLARGEGPFVIEVRWMRWDGFVLTTARAELGGQG